MPRQTFDDRFGPKVVEAIVLVIKDEINLLRAQHSLPERTNEQIISAIEDKLETIGEY